MKMNGISTKVGAGALAGALTAILVWAVGLSGLVIPPEVAVAISVVITFIVSFFVPETATVDATGATIKTVVSTNPADAQPQAVEPGVEVPQIK